MFAVHVKVASLNQVLHHQHAVAAAVQDFRLWDKVPLQFNNNVEIVMDKVLSLETHACKLNSHKEAIQYIKEIIF